MVLHPVMHKKNTRNFCGVHGAKTPSTLYKLRMIAGHSRLTKPATALSRRAHETIPKDTVYMVFIWFVHHALLAIPISTMTNHDQHKTQMCKNIIKQKAVY